MKTLQLAMVGLGAVFALTACDGGGGICDSGDCATGTPTTDDDGPGPLLIMTAESACPNGSAWTHKAETQNWTFGAEVTAFSTRFTPTWDESHDLESVDAAADRSYDRIEVSGLTGSTPPAQFTPNVNSVIPCDDVLDYTYAVRVWDENGQMADCVVYGHDPAQIINGTYDNSTTGINMAQFSNCVDIN